MYLILYPSTSQFNSTKYSYDSVYTSDKHKVSEALKQLDVRAYKLDGLVEVKEIHVTYVEVTKELT